MSDSYRYFLPSPFCRLSFLVFRLSSFVSRLSSLVSRLSSLTSCLPPISLLPSPPSTSPFSRRSFPVFRLPPDLENKRLLALCRNSYTLHYESYFLTSKQITELRKHYGDEVGWYYVWMNHYTRWLMVPAVVGLMVQIW